MGLEEILSTATNDENSKKLVRQNLNIVCEESERIQHKYLSIMESELIGLVEMFSSIDVDVIHSVLESYGT